MKWRHVLVSINICIALLPVSGCKKLDMGKQDIVNNFFISVCGVDKDAGDNLLITVAQRPVTSSDDGQDGKKKKMEIITEAGITVFEANRRIRVTAHKDLFWGHMDYLIVGEAAARKDFLECLDYFVHDHETRLGALVMVVKETSAKVFIEETRMSSDMAIDERLSNQFNNLGRRSMSGEVKVYQCADMFLNERRDACLPCVMMRDTMPTQEEGEQDIVLNGFAVFKDERLIDFIHDEMARGYNWIIGEVISGYINVKSAEGEDITLEIVRTGSSLDVSIAEGILTADIKVQMSTNIGEVRGREFAFDEDSLAHLIEAQNQVVRSEIRDVIDFAKANNADIFGFEDAYYHARPLEWEREYRDKWDELFPQMNVDISVESDVLNSYMIDEGLKSGEEESK